MSETPEQPQVKETYAVVEMMGHRKVVGLIDQSQLAPGALIRIDVLGFDGAFERTEHIGSGSVYCITEVTKEVAVAAAKRNAPRPTFAYGLPAAPPYSTERLDQIDDDDDDEDDYGFQGD